MPHTRSFWLETAGPVEARPPWTGDGRADVAIVGGGFTGLSTAYHLKAREPGLRVVVLEAGTVAGGASGRNAGFAMTLFGLDLGFTVFRFGRQRAKEADDYMVRAVHHTRDMVHRLNIDCDYEEHGLITVATNPAQQRRLHHHWELSRSLGLHETRWLDRDQTRELVGSPTYLASCFDPLCALVHPAKLARGMARAVLELGGEIYEGSPVTALHPGSPAVLELPGGRLTADSVVLATNAYTWALGRTVPRLKPVQAPMHTYIVLTEPLSPERLEAVGWRRRVGVEDGRNLIHYYRLTPDNRLLMGGHDALYYYGNRSDRDHHAGLARRLQQAVVETFPALRGIRFTHHWGGPVSVNLDLAPVIGRVGGNIFYSAGCMGHGVALTQLNGRTLADLVLGVRSDLTDVFFVDRRVLPLPPEPLRFPLINAIRGLLRLQDWWNERARQRPPGGAGMRL
ncbi:MAG: FAD-binding oxidoreductase [Thermaerobacter sp.]